MEALMAAPGLAAAALCLAFAWWAASRFRARDFSREKPYSIHAPFPLSGVPDLVRQESGGELTIHDLKTRSRALWFESDRIQLSLYRLLVSRATGRKVKEVGYIRVRSPGKADQLLEVPLYGEEQLVALYDRYIALLDGRESARWAKSPALCGLCGFNQKQCFPPQKREPAKAGFAKTGSKSKAGGRAVISGPAPGRRR